MFTVLSFLSHPPTQSLSFDPSLGAACSFSSEAVKPHFLLAFQFSLRAPRRLTRVSNGRRSPSVRTLCRVRSLDPQVFAPKFLLQPRRSSRRLQACRNLESIKQPAGGGGQGLRKRRWGDQVKKKKQQLGFGGGRKNRGTEGEEAVHMAPFTWLLATSPHTAMLVLKINKSTFFFKLKKEEPRNHSQSSYTILFLQQHFTSPLFKGS